MFSCQVVLSFLLNCFWIAQVASRTSTTLGSNNKRQLEHCCIFNWAAQSGALQLKQIVRRRSRVKHPLWHRNGNIIRPACGSVYRAHLHSWHDSGSCKGSLWDSSQSKGGNSGCCLAPTLAAFSFSFPFFISSLPTEGRNSSSYSELSADVAFPARPLFLSQVRHPLLVAYPI